MAILCLGMFRAKLELGAARTLAEKEEEEQEEVEKEERRLGRVMEMRGRKEFEWICTQYMESGHRIVESLKRYEA